MNKRDKRHEHNIVVENALNEEKYPQWIDKDNFDQLDRNRESQDNFHATSHNLTNDKNEKFIKNLDANEIKFDSKSNQINYPNDLLRSNSWSYYLNEKQDMTRNTESNDVNSNTDWSEHSTKVNYINDNTFPSSEEEFDMHEIGNPDLLYTVQVQLFEKLNTPEGKTFWNDMTKGKPAR